MDINTRDRRYGSFVKWLLHTRFGNMVGFYLGISGYNKMKPIVNRFQRYYSGEKLKKNEILSVMDEELGIVGVFVQKHMRPSFNSRVDAGAALCASLISGTTLGGLTSPSAAKYIALSTSTLTPAKTDTTLTGETSATGLARTTGTAGTYSAPSTLDGAASYILTKTFTNTSGGSVTLNSSAIFDAASTGNMLAEVNFSASATLANNDQIIINWTVNL